MSRIHSDGYFTFYFLLHSDSLFYILCVRYIWWLLLVVKFPASSTKLEIRKGLVMKLSSAAASITVTNPFAAFSGKTCKSLIHRLTFIANLNQPRELTYCKSKSQTESGSDHSHFYRAGTNTASNGLSFSFTVFTSCGPWGSKSCFWLYSEQNWLWITSTQLLLKINWIFHWTAWGRNKKYTVAGVGGGRIFRNSDKKTKKIPKDLSVIGSNTPFSFSWLHLRLCLIEPQIPKF